MHRPERSLLLVRHGQSEWNAVKRWQGIADSPLSALGRRQAQAIGRALASDGDVRFSIVASSDLSRASETAAIIAGELGVGDVITDARLREADAGPWEGMTPREIAERWPGFLETHRRPAGFETTESVVARATEASVDLLRRIDGRIDTARIDTARIDGRITEDGLHSAIAITHSGLIRSLRRHLGAADEPVPNLGGVWVHLSDDDLHLGSLFTIDGLTISGVDGPGEDPGEQAEEPGDRGRAERGLAG
jgi:probable phosphoglycerate mutase